MQRFVGDARCLPRRHYEVLCHICVDELIWTINEPLPDVLVSEGDIVGDWITKSVLRFAVRSPVLRFA